MRNEGVIDMWTRRNGSKKGQWINGKIEYNKCLNISSGVYQTEKK